MSLSHFNLRKKLVLATYLIILLFTFQSCQKDNILFLEEIQQEIEENIEETESNDPVTGEPIIDKTVSSNVKAFPSAYGAGSQTTGGRGGRVIHVTNLYDSGPGSLREAVMAYGPRIVVFDVSGTIELLTDLNIYEGNLTIAGQTAPEGGITITGRSIKMSSNQWTSANNLIFRYFRVRPDFIRNGIEMCIQLNNVNNVVLDHLSLSWAGDKAIGISDVAYDITVQNTLIGESNTGMILGLAVGYQKYNSHDISCLRNIFYDSSHRFPNFNGSGRFDAINNVGYNYRYRLVLVGSEAQTNVINNYYDAGSGNPNLYPNDAKMKYMGFPEFDDIDKAEIYASGNKIKNYNPSDEWNMWTTINNDKGSWDYKGKTYTSGTLLPEADFRTFTQFPQLGAAIDILPVDSLLDNLLINTGANKVLTATGSSIKDMDDVDKRYIDNMSKRIYTNYEWNEDWGIYQHYINWQNNVSRTPKKVRSSNFDTDRDGMPDVWEKANGFNPLLDDSALDADGDGYTNIEEYLNSIDLD